MCRLNRTSRLALAATVLTLITATTYAATPNGMVVLFTDYGADSVYVGAIKGSIYTKFPQARIDAITNSVPAFDVVTGAYMLVESCKEFPQGTTFCCVVDPGVGTPRKRIVLETKNGYYFVAPDNGLVSLAAERFGTAAVHEIANQTLWRPGDPSHTFQGRDIFGPVAAAVARGTSLAEIGPPIAGLVQLDVKAPRAEGNAAFGTVIRTDDYGNMVTNLAREDLAKAGIKQGDMLDVTIGKKRFQAPWASTYADVAQGKCVVMVQSSGYVECAVNKGSLSNRLKEGVHAPVIIRRGR